MRKGFIPLLHAFHVYKQIFVFFTPLGNKLQLQLALGWYVEHLMKLWGMYTWDFVRAYHLDFHQAHILERIDNSQALKTINHELKLYLLKARHTQNENSNQNQNSSAGGKLSTPFMEICFK